MRRFIMGLFTLLLGQTVWAGDFSSPKNQKNQSPKNYVMACDEAQLAAAQKTEKALQRPVIIPRAATLSEAFKSITAQTGVRIMSRKVEDEIDLNHRTPENLSGLSAATILDILLEPDRIAWLARDQYVWLYNKYDDDDSVIWIYEVDDLVSWNHERKFSYPDFNSLINLITDEIEPQTWDESGGPGGISGFRSAGALVISQSPKTHQKIALLLDKLREARDAQGLSRQ